MIDRRSLLKSTLVSMGAATVPTFLSRSAVAAAEDQKPRETILVVVQLIGGNDGLNTVVPHAMEGYEKHRKVLRLPKSALLNVNKEVGLHPSMGGMAKLLEAGRLAIVQGVGYPNPDRSHFRSMEIWESARVESGALETGWLGRALDAHPTKPGADAMGVHIGKQALPLAFRSKRSDVPSLEGLEQYRLQLAGGTSEKDAARASLDGMARVDRRDDALLGFLRRSTLAAYESSKRLEAIAQPAAGASKYPNYGLARRLELIGQLIKSGFGTRIYYTALDGFDTHANQLGTHSALLTELSASLGAFQGDLSAAGQADRVAVVAFSEFGRRVAENASGGTDHGAAAPLFVVGPVAAPGLVGIHPGLDKLDDGDLIHHTDFRRVYASLLQEWLGVEAAPIVGPGFAPMGLMRAGRA